MEKITITVDVNGSSISREYCDITTSGNQIHEYLHDEQRWGGRIIDMLDTLRKSEKIPF